ncbi:hypothetical protein RIF23_14650 [Lipingzhangella sp. LS1_29]|uniref:Uncharacterized protein n=1 Tax=Lipingzhangella rawalii TaxID=2055835 RepID=A0ABU2H8B3_9ACTN|nr:hypothetical protein [Lipingzhangella rawalii]MDS1271536.1 hypothetical protein [Lipingzhangella rawalii]
MEARGRVRTGPERAPGSAIVLSTRITDGETRVDAQLVVSELVTNAIHQDEGYGEDEIPDLRVSLGDALDETGSDEDGDASPGPVGGSE